MPTTFCVLAGRALTVRSNLHLNKRQSDVPLSVRPSSLYRPFTGPLQYPARVCHCTSFRRCPRSPPPPLLPRSGPPLAKMDDSGYNRGHSFGFGRLHFVPLTQHRAFPNKRSTSCIFNLLTDAIILYTPRSLILMQLLLFIAGGFFPPLLLFHLGACALIVCPHSAFVRPIRTGRLPS